MDEEYHTVRNIEAIGHSAVENLNDEDKHTTAWNSGRTKNAEQDTDVSDVIRSRKDSVTNDNPSKVPESVVEEDSELEMSNEKRPAGKEYQQIPEILNHMPDPVIWSAHGGEPDIDFAKQIMNKLLGCWDTDEARERLDPIVNVLEPKWKQERTAKHIMLHYVPAAVDIAEKAIEELGFQYNPKSEGRTFESVVTQLQECAKLDEILMFQFYILKQKFVPIEYRPKAEPRKSAPLKIKDERNLSKNTTSKSEKHSAEKDLQIGHSEESILDKKNHRNNDVIYQAMMYQGSSKPKRSYRSVEIENKDKTPTTSHKNLLHSGAGGNDTSDNLADKAATDMVTASPPKQLHDTDASDLVDNEGSDTNFDGADDSETGGGSDGDIASESSA